ncbi:MAG: beta-N-acetylglucosaminidase, partial [Bacteroidetes bacterium]
MKWMYGILGILLAVSTAAAQSNPLVAKDSLAQNEWVEHQYEHMTLEERIGQLFMVMASCEPEAEVAESRRIRDLISKFSPGGIIFSRGVPGTQVRLTNTFQKASGVPLLIAMDAEWGLAMRLDSTFAFPWNMTLGAVQDTSLIEEIGYQIGSHARRMGVHMNFAPVVDINTNPQNPIIGNRSFGENPFRVSRQATHLMRGMQRAGVLCTAKHFPGHGDTSVDSHKGLPSLTFDRRRLDSVELIPFKDLIAEGLSTVMVAHLDVPSLTGVEGEPTSLSRRLLRDVLEGDLGFQGLICTDALNMKGVTTYDSAENAGLAAFLAGNDLLLMPEDLERDHQALLGAYRSGRISEARLSRSVKKVLMAKYKAGLSRNIPVEPAGLNEDLNTP